MTKSKRIRLIALVSAATLGAFCAYYRVQMARYGTELTFGGIGYSPGLLFAAIAVCVLAFILMSVFFSAPEDERRSPAGILVKLFLAVSGIGFIAAAVLSLPDAGSGAAALIHTIFAAVCGTAILIRAATGERSASSGLLSLFPVYFLCYFLLRFYRANASNPSVLSFCLELIGSIFVTLAAYAICSVKFENTRDKPRFFLCLTAVYFAVLEAVSLALMPPAVLSVPGFSLSAIAVLFSAGVYAGAGLFVPPAAGDRRTARMILADGAEPAGHTLTAKQILVDELSARVTEQPLDADAPDADGKTEDTVE